jgi:hypothetical protein
MISERAAMTARRSWIAVGIAVLIAVGGLPATAHGAGRTQADVQQKVASWDSAAARLGLAGSLWEPVQTVGLPQTGRISVIAGNLAFADGAVAAGDTFAGARYGTASRGLRISEKWASTGWAAEPAFSTSMAKVRSVVVPLGLPGTKVALTADVYANCFPQPADRNPRPIPARFRCSRGDVVRTGGVLMMTARPASQMMSQGDTTILIESTGLTFDQLVRVARGLQQVAGSGSDGAGSAQMVGMCRQMVDARMTSAQAGSFASAYGYSSRVGSVDGVGLAVTADYRPDRFTLAVTADAVSSCTYG